MTKHKDVVVGISGGVDSSVSAYLLIENKYNVAGVFANCFYTEQECRNSSDLKDAIELASKLGIVLTVKDYRQTYSDKVLQYFYEGYKSGQTPNPDILCNSEVKFGVMASDVFSEANNACLATGHYVANRQLGQVELMSLLDSGGLDRSVLNSLITSIYKGDFKSLNFLFSGADAAKDQSYFLYKLYDRPENLHRYIFPLGELTKTEVRSIAKDAGIKVAGKPDSQGICFIGDIKLRGFIKNHVKGTPGNVVNLEGEVIGSHSGVQYYTVGQRHGFHVSTYSSVPLYIVEKKIDTNTLVVGERSEAYFKGFVVGELSFPYSIENLLEKFNDLNLSVRVRNLGRKIPCRVSGLVDGKIEVELIDPEFGVAVGQSAVFYIDRLMLGGGVIESATRVLQK